MTSGNVEWVGWSSGPDNVWEKCPQCGTWQRITEPQILCDKHAGRPS
jgi:hypothetical protein